MREPRTTIRICHYRMSDHDTAPVPTQPVIQFLHSHRVLLCTACPKTTCIPPNAIAGHLYHWTLLRGPPRAGGPSIILCVKKWSPRAPQRGGSPHSGEGKNGGSHLITAERRGYKKIPLVGFQDIYYIRRTYKTRFDSIGQNCAQYRA